MIKYTLSLNELKKIVLKDDVVNIIQDVLDSKITSVACYKKHKNRYWKNIDDLRKILNKITTRNYDTLEPKIYKILIQQLY